LEVAQERHRSARHRERQASEQVYASRRKPLRVFPFDRGTVVQGEAEPALTLLAPIWAQEAAPYAFSHRDDHSNFVGSTITRSAATRKRIGHCGALAFNAGHERERSDRRARPAAPI
jgi:hypothetical protein